MPLSLAFPFALSFARIGIIVFEISLLQGMELLRARLYAQVFGNDPPSLSLVRLVLLRDDLNGPGCYLTDPEAHVCVAWSPHARHYCFNLRNRNPELGRKLDFEGSEIGLRLDIQVFDEAIQIGRSEGR